MRRSKADAEFYRKRNEQLLKKIENLEKLSVEKCSNATGKVCFILWTDLFHFIYLFIQEFSMQMKRLRQERDSLQEDLNKFERRMLDVWDFLKILVLK